MFCDKCGQQLDDGDIFCFNCGNAVGTKLVKKTTVEQKLKPPVAKQPDKTQEKKTKKKTAVMKRKMPKSKRPKWTQIAAISAVVLILAAAVLVPLLIAKDRANRYEAAMDLMEDGKMEKARDRFIELKTYKEAEYFAIECQYSIDYDDAQTLMKDGKYKLAKAGFVALDEYSDAANQAKNCQKAIDYNAAVSMMDKDENEGALEIFARLREYKDSEEHAAECRNRIDYDAAVDMMTAQNYTEAEEAFEALDGFRQSDEFALECRNTLDYANAIAMYGRGEYYGAYLIFERISGFSDAEQRAMLCIQEPPGTSEIYRNDDYSSRRVSISIYGPTNDVGILTLVKVYTTDDELVSVMFINGDDRQRVKLPSGDFVIKRASGYTWFGEEDMFGDDGYYTKLIFADGDPYMTLKSNYDYTLRFSVADGNVGGNNEDREDF